MRIYGSVSVCFWEKTSTQQLSDQAKLLAIYLLTGPHSNMLGCFRLPNGYITEDLKWDANTVKEGFLQLSKIAFLTRDENTGWLVIHEFLKWNPIQNPKQGIGIKKLFDIVPSESMVLKPLVKGLLTHAKYLEEGFRDRLTRLVNHSDTLFQKDVTDQDQDQDQEQNQNNIFMSGKPDVVYLKDFSFIQEEDSKTTPGKQYQAQAIEVLDFLNEKTGRCYRPTDANLKLIIARLKSDVTVMDCRQVIAKKYREWKADAKMVEYLRPATLFNATKFEQYLGELVEVNEGEVYATN